MPPSPASAVMHSETTQPGHTGTTWRSRAPEHPLSPLSRLAAYFTSQQVLQGRSRALVVFDDAEDLDDPRERTAAADRGLR